jgi:hypothetical protein
MPKLPPDLVDDEEQGEPERATPDEVRFLFERLVLTRLGLVRWRSPAAAGLWLRVPQAVT